MTTPPGTRRNWWAMTGAERKSWINALQNAKLSGQYDVLTKTHQMGMLGDANEWHRRPIILPVHRWFLTQLEVATGQPTPYWDWTRNRRLPPALGGDGDPTQGYLVTTGPFVNWTSVIFDTTTGGFDTRPGIIRQTGVYAAGLPTAVQLTTVLSQTVYDSSPWNPQSTTGLRNWLEGWTGLPKPAMHNRVHEWVGGDMRTSTSPNDPLFWLHHSNIDRIWASWQQVNGVSNYAAPAGQGPDDPLPLTNGVTPSQMFPIPLYDAYL